jgi:hypothetical protein
MKNSKTGVSGNDSGIAEPPLQSAETAESDEGLLALYGEWLKVMNNISARIQQRYAQIQADYMRTLYEMQINSHKWQQEAYQNYLLATPNAADVQQRYMKDMESCQSQVLQSLADIQQTTSSSLQEIQEAANRELEQAHFDYISGIQDRFSRLDMKTASPGILYLIGQSLLWAATNSPKCQNSAPPCQ